MVHRIVQAGQRRTRVLLPAISGIVLLLAGCASGIRVTHLTEDSGPATGNPWNLAMTQFDITITRHITQCGEVIKGRSEVLATPRAVLDEDQRYVLLSNGWWATSDITSNLAASGVSTGLNAQSADRTPAVIANLIGTAAQIAIGRASGATMLSQEFTDAKVELCTGKVAAAVARLYPPEGSKRPGLKKVVEARTAELAQATAKVALLTAQAKADKSLNKQLVAALDEQEQRHQELSRSQDALEANVRLTTSTQAIRWPNKATEFWTDKPYDVDSYSLGNWFVPLGDEDMEKVKKEFHVYFRIYARQRSDGRWIAPSPPQPANVDVGVPVRLAQVGRMLTCFKQACPDTVDESPPPEGTERTATDQVILQLGHMYVVPLTGGTFKAENAVVSMDAGGLPSSIQVVEKSAAAEALSGTLKDSATQLAALPAQVRAAELAKTKAATDQLSADAALAAAQSGAATQAQVSALATQTALINAQAALATAKTNANLPLQTAEVSAQTALLNAQAALVTAQASAGTVDQTSALGARTALINAQAAQINAATALAKAQVQLP